MQLKTGRTKSLRWKSLIKSRIISSLSSCESADSGIDVDSCLGNDRKENWQKSTPILSKHESITLAKNYGKFNDEFSYGSTDTRRNVETSDSGFYLQHQRDVHWNSDPVYTRETLNPFREISSDNNTEESYTQSSSSSTSSTTFAYRTKNFRSRKWLKTADILKKSGLLDITIKTSELLKKNQELQKEIKSLQQETTKFILSVLKNPENQNILGKFQSQSELFEMMVPGSQMLMTSCGETQNKTIFSELSRSFEANSLSVNHELLK